MTKLCLACIDTHAPPLFEKSPDGVTRAGYEPDVAALIGEVLGREVEWYITGWDNMIPSVLAGEADAVLCGQGMIPERIALVDFTQPYAIFNETVLVRAGDPARDRFSMSGYKVGAIKDSANIKVARTIEGAEIVEFSSDDVFSDMINALLSGEIDAFVDDDVVMVPMGDLPEFDVAFTALTRNPWGIAVKPGNTQLLADINRAIDTLRSDGRLRDTWKKWMPGLEYPLES